MFYPSIVENLARNAMKNTDKLCLADEKFDTSKDMIIFDPIETWKKTKIHADTY